MSIATFAAVERRAVEATHALLDNAVVTPANGAPFAAMLKPASSEAFDVVAVGDHTLRYITSSAPDLKMSDMLTVGDRSFRLAEPPRIHGAHEKVVALFEVAA